MPNVYQLQLIKKSVTEFNLYIEQNRDIKIDLSNANLSEVNLTNANLKDADLGGAKLTGADLQSADLTGADLTGADLGGVKGIYAKGQEMKSATNILNALDVEGNELGMSEWHTCDTKHCICGWEAHLNQISLEAASTHHPTLCKYYYASEKEALKALRRVASGEESVWN